MASQDSGITRMEPFLRSERLGSQSCTAGIWLFELVSLGVELGPLAETHPHQLGQSPT